MDHSAHDHMNHAHEASKPPMEHHNHMDHHNHADHHNHMDHIEDQHAYHVPSGHVHDLHSLHSTHVSIKFFFF